MSRPKVELAKEAAVRKELESLVKTHGAVAVRRAWNHLDKLTKERESLLKQKHEAEAQLKKIDERLGK